MTYPDRLATTLRSGDDGLAQPSKSAATGPGAPSVPDYSQYDRVLEQRPLVQRLAVQDNCVQAAASLPEGDPERVAHHHANVFDALHEATRSKHEGLLERSRDEERGIKAHVASLQRELSHGPPEFRDVPGDGTPWTTYSIVKFSVLVLVSAVLIFVGVLSLGQILLTSGIPGFEEPWRRYAFSFVPIAAAFVLKSLGGLFSLDRNLRRYTGFLHILGVGLAVFWAIGFVQTFGSGMGQSVEAILGQVLSDDPPSKVQGESSGNGVLLAGLLAEVCLAAALWLSSERIVEQHRSARRSQDQRYAFVAQTLRVWNDHLTRITAVAREFDGRVRELDKARNAYIEGARDAYELRRRGIEIYHRRARGESDD